MKAWLSLWLWLGASACISAGARTGVGITSSGKTWFEAGGTPVGAEWRSKDLSDSQEATFYRAGEAADFVYRPDDDTFGGGIGLAGGATHFWGRVGLGVNLVAGWRGVERLSGGESHHAFVLRLELGVDLETSRSDWGVVPHADSQSPGTTDHCPRTSSHSFISIIPAIEYAAWNDRPDEVSFVLDLGWRHTWDPCSPFALGP